MRHKIALAGLPWQCDSAGTHAYHVGECPDPRTLEVCHKYGVDTEGIIARQVTRRDFTDFDVIFGMDRGHVDSLIQRCPANLRTKIAPFCNVDIPDPYYGDIKGFYNIFNMINGNIERLICRTQEIV